MTEIGDAYVNVETVERDAQRRVERRRHSAALRARVDEIERKTPELVVELGLELREVIADVVESYLGLYESHSESGSDCLDTRVCLDIFDKGCGDGQGRFELGTAYLHIFPVDTDMSAVRDSHDSSSSVGSGVSDAGCAGCASHPTEGDPRVVLDLSMREASILQGAISAQSALLRKEKPSFRVRGRISELERLSGLLFDAEGKASSLAGTPGHGPEARPVHPSAGLSEPAGEDPARE